jgi:DNA-binding GntR family transcriptional regulator
VEQVHRELRDRIFAGAWALGSRVYEDQIATELAVSRASIREAVRLLEHEGLLVRVPHRGLFVASPTGDQFRDLITVRALLESSAVTTSRRHTRTEIQDMRQVIRDMDQATRADSVLDMVQLDLAFHSTVVSVSSNQTLLRYYHDLDGHMALFLHALTDDRKSRLLTMGRRHRMILQALEGRDAQTIMTQIAQHYRTASDELFQIAAFKNPVSTPDLPSAEGQ